MRFLPAALLFITLPFTVQAYTPEISSLPTVAQLRVDPATIAPAISAIKNQPLLFAVGTAMNVATDAGTWDEPQAGVARWRLRINSSGARALNFRFNDLQLPENAKLYVYTSDGADVQGPRSEEHTSELQSLMRISSAVCCFNI